MTGEPHPLTLWYRDHPADLAIVLELHQNKDGRPCAQCRTGQPCALKWHADEAKRLLDSSKPPNGTKPN